MLRGLSRRLLTLLQLTRMALVFTAIADAQCGLLLRDGADAPAGDLLRRLWPERMLAVAVISVGLYGFGMSFNDIIDRRRDRQISPTRPLPSGRIGIVTAHVICIGLALAAVLGGMWLRELRGGNLGLALVGLTLALIAFYDLAGKYLVGPGLVTLGLVRFFQAMVPAAQSHPPFVPVVWHPLWLLNHVTILSMICYWWEEKRPPLTRRHWWGVLGSLAVIDAAFVTLVGGRGPGSFVDNLNVRPGLLLPVAAAGGYVLSAWGVRGASAPSPGAGPEGTVHGLLWPSRDGATVGAVCA